MTLTDCQLLSIVAQLGTFAAAAERLHITPSAVSHEVSGVEIPQEIVKRLEGASQQQAWDITAPYAAGLMKQAAPHCDGYYLMTPLRKTALVIRLMQEGLA